MTPFEELCRTFKLKLKADESFAGFATRASDLINKCSDAQWKELSGPLQVWANKTLEAREANRGKEPDDDEYVPIPELAGFPEPEPEANDDGEEESADDSDNGGDADGEETNDDIDDLDVSVGVDNISDDDSSEGDGEEPEEGVDAEASEGQNDAQDEGEGGESQEDKPVRRTSLKSNKKSKTVGKKAKPEKPDKKPGKGTSMRTPVKRAAAAAAKRGRRAAIGDNDVIKVLAKENPYRADTLGHKFFTRYRDGMRVKELTGKTKALPLKRPAAAMLRFDAKKGYVKIVPAA